MLPPFISNKQDSLSEIERGKLRIDWKGDDGVRERDLIIRKADAFRAEQNSRALSSVKSIKTQNDDQKTGVEIVRKAITAPIKQIAQNAGHDGAVVAGNLLRENDETQGFNAATDTYENLKAAGVIDPTKVVRTALQDAASVSGLLITTEAAISEKPEDKPAMPPMGGGMGGMGGMDF